MFSSPQNAFCFTSLSRLVLEIFRFFKNHAQNLNTPQNNSASWDLQMGFNSAFKGLIFVWFLLVHSVTSQLLLLCLCRKSELSQWLGVWVRLQHTSVCQTFSVSRQSRIFHILVCCYIIIQVRLCWTCNKHAVFSWITLHWLMLYNFCKFLMPSFVCSFLLSYVFIYKKLKINIILTH